MEIKQNSKSEEELNAILYTIQKYTKVNNYRCEFSVKKFFTRYRT